MSIVFPIYVICPTCKGTIQVNELNCCIFRHAVFRDTMEQIDPHASKELCDEYIQKGLIYGCGKPFKVILQNEKYTAEICDYI
jgi:hypothetical protein